MGEPIDSRGLGNRGIGNRGTGNRGTGNRGLGNRGLGNRGTGNPGTGNRAVGSPPPSPRYLTGVPEVVFSDVVIGDVARTEVWIFNTHLNSEAYLQLAVDAARDVPTDVAPFQIASAPQRLRPSREGAPMPIVLVFHPERLVDVRGTLTVTARWQDPSIPAEQFQVVVLGWSREAGAPLRADQQAAAASIGSGIEDAVGKARRVEAMRRRVREDGDEPYPQGKANELEREFALAGADLDRLSKAQEFGVDVVEKEAENFQASAAQVATSLKAELFWFAVDVATAGIAARVATAVGKRFAEEVIRAPRRTIAHGVRWRESLFRVNRTPLEGPLHERTALALLGPDGLAVLDEMVQAVVIGSMDEARSQLGLGDATASQRVEADARIDFFAGQRDRVADRAHSRRYSLIEFHTFMKPLLRDDPELALTAIRAFRTVLRDQQQSAREIQSIHTRQAWMNFLSHGAIGSLSRDELLNRGLRVLADTTSVTDAAKLAAPFTGPTPPAYAGVLDVYFRANRMRPQEPIIVERVHMNGVQPGVLRACLDGVNAERAPRLGDLRVAIRAIAVSPGISSFGIVVVRDEAGNVFSSDASGATVPQSTWLARRAAHTQNTPGKQRDGAALVMNDLLKTTTKGLIVTTDGA